MAPRRAVTAQKPFTLLVATLKQGSDPSRGPSGNPQVHVQTYTQQLFPQVPGIGPRAYYPGIQGLTTQTGVITGSRQRSSAEITVTSANFLGPTSILLGQYTLISGEDFTVDPASAANTATAIAAIISTLPGYSATALGAVVSLEGPEGPDANRILFEVSGVSAGNLTLNPSDGSLGGAGPTFGPPLIT